MDDVPLIYEIVNGLLRKGETVRVDLERQLYSREEGTLVSLRVLDDIYVNVGGDSGQPKKRCVIVWFDTITTETIPAPLAFTFNELENHSNLQRLDVGWLLTINREKPM